MARKKGTRAGETSRDELKKYNDRRYSIGTEGVKAKEERAIKKTLRKLRG